jgi:putative ABC transport system permease protein
VKSWIIAIRTLCRRPGFTVTALLLLTLGVGVETTLFSVLNTVLLRPLPFPQASELVTVMEASAAKSQKVSLMAPVRIEEWNRYSRTFLAISGTYSENLTDTGMAQPERLSGARTAPRYFEVFGMPALVGRTFTPEEEVEGGPLGAVISYGLWARRYGLDPQITRRRLMIGGKGYSIVGVMPKTFSSSGVEVWIPAQLSAYLRQARDARFLSGVGRMKPGVTIAQAQADLTALESALGGKFPATDRGWSAMIGDLKEFRTGRAAGAVALLFGAVSLLLAITVSNISGLMLAQLDRRGREMAIRASLGATRGQIVASLMREVVVIAVAAGVCGYLLARFSLAVTSKLFVDTPRMAELTVDARALVFAVFATAAAALFFGLLPALRATAAIHASTLIRLGRGAGAARRPVQQAIVCAQVALTMLLLSGAALLLRSYYNMSHVQAGFDAKNVILFHVGAGWDENRGMIGLLQERLITGLSRIQGVQAAGMTNFLPASDATLRSNITLEGAARTEETGKMPVGYRLVSPGYLRALRVPLLEGAWCPELTAGAAPAGQKIMVNRRFVEVYGQGKDVLGRHIAFEGFGPQGLAASAIVGVIGDMKEDSLAAPAYPYVYNCASGGNWPDPEYAVRTAGDLRGTMNAIRRLVRQIARGRPIFGVQTLEQSLAASLDRPRSNAHLLLGFAFAAMLLAAVGLYGLVAQMVAASRHEMGVRMALGASPARIVGTVITNAGRLIGIGIGAGAILMLALRPVARSLVFGVSPLDAADLAYAAAGLAAVSLAAAIIPARRAAAINPTECMRSE